jgi:hypothetical protein
MDGSRMPIAIDTDPGKSFATLTITDPYTFEEWREAMEAVLVSPVFAATKAMLVDMRDAVAPSLVFVDQVVGFFGSHETQLGKARVGIVTSETLAFGMSRMVELKSEASLPSAVIRVFRDDQTATRWLTRRETVR